ncbi:MAG: hypothetical protein WBN89_06710 [Prochlorococcaceae cyanobacterium]
MTAGIVPGQLFPGLFAALAAVEVARINLVVALLIWLMIFPMMLAVDFSAIGNIRGEPQALIVTLAMNWLAKPFTMALLFGFQATTILANPVLIVLLAIPLILQTVLIFTLTALWMRQWRQPHDLAAPGALIGASNFFELAVAVAISLFGVRSGAALATVVGVLVEVPVMLVLVAIANRSRRLFPYRSSAV